MSIRIVESTTPVEGIITSLVPAKDEADNRKKMSNGREWSVLTVEFADEEQSEDIPVWVDFETASLMYTVGKTVTLLVEEKVRTSRSVKGIAA